METRFRIKPADGDIEIASRLKTIRQALGIGDRLAAARIGLSREQLRRIERGQSALRFFPGWNFCKFTNTNPLWLAFGEGFIGRHGVLSFGKHGFLGCANNDVPDDALFLDVMRVSAAKYVQYRKSQFEHWSGVGTIFSKIGSAQELRESRPKSDETLFDEIELAMSGREYYSRLMLAADHVGSWEELRALLQKALSPRGAKKEVAVRFGISSQAVSHWLSGKSAPPADTALQLRKWLADASLNPTQERAETAVTAPALTNRKSSSTTNEKTKSDRKHR